MAKQKAYKESVVPDAFDVHYYDRYRLCTALYPEESAEPEFVVFEQWEVPESPTDKFYEVKAGCQRLDAIALKHYGTVRLWWLLALANNIDHPWEELPVGTVLRIPDLAALEAHDFFTPPLARKLAQRREWNG